MEKRAYFIGGFLFFLAVAIGAFGAHGLEDILNQNDRSGTFETGVKYHFYHSIAILIVGLIAGKYKEIKFDSVIYLHLFGTIIFSGSLYILSVTNIGIFGAITPIGGLCFLIGWILFILKIKKI